MLARDPLLFQHVQLSTLTLPFVCIPFGIDARMWSLAMAGRLNTPKPDRLAQLLQDIGQRIRL